MKRPIVVPLFLLWTGIIVTAYYVVQKPGLLYAFSGLAGTLWTLIVAALLLFNAYGLGEQILHWLGLQSIEGIERLLLGCGMGLGVLGLLGLGISAAHMASRGVFFFFTGVTAAILVFNRSGRTLRSDLRSLAAHWMLSWSQSGRLAKIALVLTPLLASLLTLVPPFEAYDALLYHLAQPARILQDGGVQAVDIAPFWFPSLSENVYLWALALGSERAAQMLHLAWAMIAALLLWRWAVRVWNVEIGRKTLLLLAAIPSLPMLASWAYADMALAFYAAAALYALTISKSTESPAWLRLAGIFAGLAMGVKYTSLTVPLTVGLLILVWGRRSFGQALFRAVRFGLIALIVATPWYVRNALIMGNPFYPFVFGGRYWDDFRSDWYAGAGTGIGWDPLQLFMLPFNVILGHRDVTFFDGRIGPLFLILAPLALWMLARDSRQDSERGLSLQAIGLFAALSFAAWTFGVINTSSLWQARLLFPTLMPFAIPAALGWDSARQMDSPGLRLSFLLNVVVAAILALTLFDNAVFVLQRNPLAVAAGAQSRQAYIARVNPSYAALIDLMDALPPDACVYHLFEPRSYGLPRCSQPDPINYNFAHDLYLYKTPAAIIQAWKARGYTHVLVYERALQFGADDPSDKMIPARREALRETLHGLEASGGTPDGAYTIYRIP